MYPRVLDINMNLVAVLNRAHKIGYTKLKNNLWTCQFTMPLKDKKNKHIKPKYFIELYDHDRYIGKFIVNPKKTIKNESTNEITYTCEHVLSTLHSDVLFGYFQYTNFTTVQILEFLMKHQEVKHWKLGKVDFKRYFHYSWENEDSLANAIFSIPKPFDVPFLWTWDDSVYPFVLNLVKPSDDIKDIIASGKNLKGIEIDEDPTNIVTRIYPLGAGEGVNQLNIKKINNGMPYLENKKAVEEYGVHKRVWVDLRFKDSESLKASAQAILDKFSKPIKSIAIDCRDYTLFERERKKKLMSQYDVGDMLLVHDQDTNTNEEIRLEKIEKNDIYGAPQDIQLELGSLIEDITTTFTDLQKKQLVNDTYSQGSTNMDSRDFQDNCDPNFPAIMRFWIPDDVVNINEMSLTYETVYYRAFERAIKGGGALVSSTEEGGALVKTTSDGGGSTQTSSSGGGSSTTSGSGGGTSKSTESGGGSTQSSAAGGDHTHLMFNANGFESNAEPNQSVRLVAANGHTIMVNSGTAAAIDYYTKGSSGNHTHSVSIPAHSHNFTTPNHTHSVTIPNHTHKVDIPNHTHSITIPAHSHEIKIPDHVHEIEYGIFEYDKLPSKITIAVDGNTIPINTIRAERFDIVPYLQKDSDGRIARGRYAEIKLTPNDLARINAHLSIRLFIQSQIGGVF